MNRNQAKEILPIIKAFSEGKIIQLKSIDGIWEDVRDNTLFNCDPKLYRIKPEPKYRPFANAKECWAEMQKHQPFGWLCDKINNQYYYITVLDDYGIATTPFDEVHYTKYTDAIKQGFTFVDGTPFGIKEEE